MKTQKMIFVPGSIRYQLWTQVGRTTAFPPVKYSLVYHLQDKGHKVFLRKVLENKLRKLRRQ